MEGLPDVLEGCRARVHALLFRSFGLSLHVCTLLRSVQVPVRAIAFLGDTPLRGSGWFRASSTDTRSQGVRAGAVAVEEEACIWRKQAENDKRRHLHASEVERKKGIAVRWGRRSCKRRNGSCKI